MSVLFAKPVESRAISFQSWWGSGDSNPTGRGDSLSVAMSLIPVYSATGLIADLFASSPWAAYDKPAGVPQRLAVQPTLITAPGMNGLDLYSWKHQLATSALLWGNAYGYNAGFDSRGMPSQIFWLRPDRVEVDETGSQPQYFFDGKHIDRSLVTHVPLYTVPGSVRGLSPLALFRTQIETGVEAQKASKNFFRRGGVPSAILRNTAKSLTAEAAQEAKQRFVASVSASEPFVTGNDWDYNTMAIPAADASFLSGIKATATQIAAIYRVAPEDVGGEVSSSSLTYKSLEQDQIRFNVRTLRPIAARVEAVMGQYFPGGQYVRFNLDASVRADLKTRYEAHQIALDAGFKTVNEVRELEELSPMVDPPIGLTL